MTKRKWQSVTLSLALIHSPLSLSHPLHGLNFVVAPCLYYSLLVTNKYCYHLQSYLRNPPYSAFHMLYGRRYIAIPDHPLGLRHRG